MQKVSLGEPFLLHAGFLLKACSASFINSQQIFVALHACTQTLA